MWIATIWVNIWRARMNRIALVLLFLFLGSYYVNAQKSPEIYERISSALPQGWHCIKSSSATSLKIRASVCIF
jgi:hypothetical protein